jgi:peptide chain release factor 2
MKEKTLLFSLTKKDFEVQTFCTGGPGGQHKNAKRNGVRIIHPASGARAEHRDGRDQHL